MQYSAAMVGFNSTRPHSTPGGGMPQLNYVQGLPSLNYLGEQMFHYGLHGAILDSPSNGVTNQYQNDLSDIDYDYPTNGKQQSLAYPCFTPSPYNNSGYIATPAVEQQYTLPVSANVQALSPQYQNAMAQPSSISPPTYNNVNDFGNNLSNFHGFNGVLGQNSFNDHNGFNNPNDFNGLYDFTGFDDANGCFGNATTNVPLAPVQDMTPNATQGFFESAFGCNDAIYPQYPQASVPLPPPVPAQVDSFDSNTPLEPQFPFVDFTAVNQVAHSPPIPTPSPISPTNCYTSPMHQLGAVDAGSRVPQAKTLNVPGKKTAGKPNREKEPGSKFRNLTSLYYEPPQPSLKRLRDTDDDAEERPAPKRSRKSTSDSSGSKATQSDTAGQLSPAVSQGDGEAVLARQHAEQNATTTHVPGHLTVISGASNSAGASTEAREYSKSDKEKKRKLQKRVLEKSIGTPIPDLTELTQGTHSVKEMVKIVRKNQLCRLVHADGKPCAQPFKGKSSERRGYHYSRGRCQLGEQSSSERGEPTVTCPLPGCGEEVDRQELGAHVAKKDHLVADARFLRLVCRSDNCDMKVNPFPPCSDWFDQMNEFHAASSCSWKAKDRFSWMLVTEEPDLERYSLEGGSKRPKRK
ncbi:hypothetical protein NMY22_g10623 [Coprinellus aureogranulatus]|nr:hypothetical protein NMY22_g10623 [Coprinellus aureogranulatus]